MLDYIRQRTIKFSGVLTIIASLIIWLIANIAQFADPFLLLRLIGLTTIYFILALISEDYRGIGEMMCRIWDIHQTEGLNEDEKMILIKNYLEAAVTQWNTYWKLYQTITNGKTLIDYKKRAFNLAKEYAERIYKGEVNIYQALSIFGYLAHSLLVSANIFAVPVPIDILVSIGFMFIILFTSGSIVGFGKFISEFFKAIAGKTESKISARLKLIEDFIINGSKSYYFITIQEENRLKSEQLLSIKKLKELRNKISESEVE